MREHDRGALKGVFVIAASTAAVWLATNKGWRIGGEDPGGWIYEYQSLIGAMLAVIGAALTIWLLWKQIAAAERLASQARRVDLTGLNRPLIASLDEMARECDEIAVNIELEYLIGAKRTPIERSNRKVFVIGAEFATIGILTDRCSAVENAMAKLRISLMDQLLLALDVLGLGEEHRRVREAAHGVIRAARSLQYAAGVVARALSAGWAPVEIKDKNIEELNSLGPPA